MSSKKKLLVSIVDYNKGAQVVEAVKSLKSIANENISLQFSIVDNSCTESNKSLLLPLNSHDNVTINFSSSNIGYVKATNLSVSGFEFDYLLILNPDVTLDTELELSGMLNWYEEQQNIGVLGIKQVNPDGSLAPVFRRFPSFLAQSLRRTPLKILPFFNKIVERYQADDFDQSEIQVVDWLQSSFWFMSKRIWRAVGPLDERFFLFMSDPDFCLRAAKQGYNNYYNPNFLAYSDGVRCSGTGAMSIFYNKVLQWHFIDAVKYYLKEK